MCCTFRVHLPHHSCFHLWLLLLFFDILEFSLNWFFTLIAFAKRGMQSHMKTRVISFWLSKNKIIKSLQSKCIQDDLLFISFVIACLLFSFWTVSGVFVRMRHDMLSLCNWDNNYLFCSWAHLSITLALECHLWEQLYFTGYMLIKFFNY